MPVLQGYELNDYIYHISMYGNRLRKHMLVGVGSVCKRNGKPEMIEDIMFAIKQVSPHLRLHGFGIKKTALKSPMVRTLLYSADSMSWSFAARRDGRGSDANRWEEAMKFVVEINDILKEVTVTTDAYEIVHSRFKESQHVRL